VERNVLVGVLISVNDQIYSSSIGKVGRVWGTWSSILGDVCHI
jgi:hypothetical protein